MKRIFLIIPTVFIIMLINFLVINFTPGSPIEQLVNRIRSGASSGFVSSADSMSLQQIEGMDYDEDLVSRLNKIYGMDRPILERFFQMAFNYIRMDFGKSFFTDIPVKDLILDRLWISLLLSVLSQVIIYIISIPLGIKKAMLDSSAFDHISDIVLTALYAIPNFLFAILLIVLFAGGSYWQIFPISGLSSANVLEMSWFERLLDYTWHLCLPLLSLALSGLTFTTMFCKNSFMKELHEPYVLNAFAKGLNSHEVVYGHVLRNAILLLLIDFPRKVFSTFFSGTTLVEIVFSINGIGLLAFESVINRDYPTIFALLYIAAIMYLIINIMNDILVFIFDKRIHFKGNYN